MGAWKGFKKSRWVNHIDVRDFIVNNYTPYYGDHSFLEGPTERTKKLWDKVSGLFKDEIKNGGILDVDTRTVSTITSHKPGYIDKDLEQIVGLQTDAPLKRAIMPFGGIRMVKNSCDAYGYELDPQVEEFVYRRELERSKAGSILVVRRNGNSIIVSSPCIKKQQRL